MTSQEFNPNHGHRVPDPALHTPAPLQPGFVSDWGKQGSFTSSYRQATPSEQVIDVTNIFEQPDISSRAPLPEATPALLGLRKWIINRRLEVKETTIKELAVKHEVLRYAGKAILSGSSYMHPHADAHPKLITSERSSRSLAPVSLSERRRASKLSKIARKAREENSLVAHLETPYNGRLLNDKKTPNPHEFSALDKPSHTGLAQSAELFWNKRLHKKLSKEVHHGVDKFHEIVYAPRVKLDLKKQQYEELLLKKQALESAITSKKQRAAAKVQAKKNAKQNAASLKTSAKPTPKD